MSAKFKTSVAMHCPTKSEYHAACKVLKTLGYIFNRFSPERSANNQVLRTYRGFEDGLHGCSSRQKKGDTLIPYNLDLLKALAAMREGEEFYPGELVRHIFSTNSVGIIGRNVDSFDDSVPVIWDSSFYDERQPFDLYSPTAVKKLTVEEILAHFNVTPSTGDNETFTPKGYTVNGEVPAVSSPAPKLPAFLLKTAENELEALRDLKKQNQHEIDTLRETGRDFDARIEELQAFLNHYKA